MNPLQLARSGLLTLAALAAAVLVLALAGVPVLPWVGDDSTPLRALLGAYVCVLGAVVAVYVATNLRGQHGQLRFAVLLVSTVAGLGVMVASSSLVLAAVGWTLSGAGLAGLVAHRGDLQARRAARVVGARLAVGDLAVWGGVIAAALGAGAEVVGLLIALGALVRSALVPAHRWLPETAEAPSPVSALLHAGVVNGGPMLCVLFWDQVGSSRPALVLLLAAGVVSVVVGLLSMRLRSDVKGRLAASTTAQMGLVALQLGLALPVSALLHLLGHGSWKAWSFLRAGGAGARLRGRQEPTSRPPMVVAVTLLVAAAVLSAGLALGVLGDVPGGLALTAGLLALVAGVGTWEAARLERTSVGLRTALVAALAVLAVAYLALVGVLDHTIHGWLPVGADTALPAPVLVTLAVVAGVALAAICSLRLQGWSAGPVATTLAATLLPPGTRVGPRVGTRVGTRVGRRLDPVKPAACEDTLGGVGVDSAAVVAELAFSTIGASWPLRSLVAANPLAPLERLSVEDAASMVRTLHGRDPRPRLSLFLDLHSRGVISEAALERSLQEHDLSASTTVQEWVTATRLLEQDGTDTAPLRVRACDGVATASRRRDLGEVLDVHVASWVSRAWGSADPGHQHDPWLLWRTAASARTYDLAWGLPGAHELARALPEDPAAALGVLWRRARRLVGPVDLYSYLAGHLATGRGWAAHARWRADRRGDAAPLLQLLALRVALDVVLAEAAGVTPRSAPAVPADPANPLAKRTVGVWQRALDLAARDSLVRALAAGASPGRTVRSEQRDGSPAPIQSVWCIDARSERMRRHLEAAGGHGTIGYAGFFGAAVQHRDADGRSSALSPGLLTPVLQTEEQVVPLSPLRAAHRLATRVGQHPAAVFGYAETSGLPALAATLAATWLPDRARRASRVLTGRPDRPGPLATGLEAEVAADVVAGMVRTTGLDLARTELLLLVGHGSSTENNAFASAYDCGACGAHPGAVSSVLVAQALNRPVVRALLAERGLPVPADLVVVAALHDTSTDRVHLFRDRDETPALRDRLDRVAHDLQVAGAATATERGLHLPGADRPGRGLVARAADWAEPMPEWGLAGNLALVVGPRSLTRDLDLGGTAFLHSYEPGADADHRMLEQVMGGPVLVTQWIQAQYYTASSAPELLGAGDKTTHNVVGDVGVLTGAHGDLRSGLPWQAVASSDPLRAGGSTTGLRHLPARHVVVVAAPPEAVLGLVRGHRSLHDTVRNGWMQLLVLDPSTGGLLELDRGLEWRTAEPLPRPVPAAQDRAH